MAVYNLKNTFNICDCIKYDFADGRLVFIQFLHNKQEVLNEFSKSYTGLSIKEFKAKIDTTKCDIKTLSVFREFYIFLKDKTLKSEVKNKIFEYLQKHK